MSVPASIRANTTAKWTESLSYDTADGWSASYVLSASGLPTITIDASSSGTDYTVDVKPTTTRTYPSGNYTYVLKVTDGTDTFVVESGTIEIIADNATGNKLLDAQSYLDAAEEEYQERVTGKPSSYSIKDRSLTRMDADELLKAISYWRKRVRQLDDEERRAKGQKSKRITYARFR